jgi:hypothetical protein
MVTDGGDEKRGWALGARGSKQSAVGYFCHLTFAICHLICLPWKRSSNFKWQKSNGKDNLLSTVPSPSPLPTTDHLALAAS